MYRCPQSLYRHLLLFSVVIIFTVIFSSNASALGIRLRAEINPNCSTGSGNPNWKFADIFADGNIAVQGSYNCRGAFIYDITNPDRPVLASWYNPGNNIEFLEAHVIGNRAYFGSGNGNGVHIVDLTNPYNPVLLGIVNSTHGNAFDSIHEMVVWGNYLIENYNCLGCDIRLKFINISDPANPVFVRDLTPTDPRWVHAMVVRGNRLFTSGWGNGSSARGRTEIYDLSNIDTQAPTLLGYVQDPSANMDAGNQMHSAWPSEDGNWLYSCREVTNSNGPTPGDLRVYDIHNPAQPLLVNSIGMTALGINAVTPHNPVVMGNYLYISWYQAGVLIFSIANPANPVKVGVYDTFPGTFAPSPKEKAALLDAQPWDLVCGSDYIQNLLPTTYDGAWAVYPFLGYTKLLVGDLAGGLFILDASAAVSPVRFHVAGIDPDGRPAPGPAVFSPATGDWSFAGSGGDPATSTQLGRAGDIAVPGDYDGDGKPDAAVFRPSNGTWYIQGSTSGFRSVQFGMNGDVPVAGDFDADGKTDVAVWRPSTGYWYVQQSTLGFRSVQWGARGDRPVTGDYEGDGKTDFAVWRPSNGMWYILKSSDSIPIYKTFGQRGDKPLSGDFDGNGVSDFAVYRPSTGTWYIQDPVTSSLTSYQFGIGEDIAVPADYDGDGKADIAVFRPSTGFWYRLNSSNGEFVSEQFGRSGDLPVTANAQP